MMKISTIQAMQQLNMIISSENLGNWQEYIRKQISKRDDNNAPQLGCVSKVSRIKELCKPDKASCQIYHAQEAPCKLLETHSHSTIIFDFHKEALYQVALLVVEIITFPRL